MKLYVLKNPTPFLRHQVQELADDAPPPAAPWEEIEAADLEVWLAAQPMITADPSFPHRVSKETLIRRVRDAGKLAAMREFVMSLPPDKIFEFQNLTSFECNNAEINAGLIAIGLRPGEMLAVDPLIIIE